MPYTKRILDRIIHFLILIFISLSISKNCWTHDNSSINSRNQFIVKENLIPYIHRIAQYSISSRLSHHDNDTLNAIKHIKWDWGEGVLMFGLAQAFEKTETQLYFQFIKSWINYHLNKGVKLCNTDDVAPTMVLSEMMLKGYLDRNATHYKHILKRAFDLLMEPEKYEYKGCKDEHNKPRKAILQWKGRTWLDDLFMTAPFMIRYSKLYDRSDLHNKITDHFLAHRDLLQCHKKGSYLLKHGYYHFKDYKLLFWIPTSNVAWGRGNGWFIAALADFLAQIPESNPSFERLIHLYRNFIEEVTTYQLNSGLFSTVLDDAKSYGEVSATALFVYAIAKGLKNNWIAGDQYCHLIEKGIYGILSNVSPAGKVGGTSAGTPVLPYAFLYKTRPRGTYSWGEGSVLMALVQVSELFDSINNIQKNAHD